MKRRSWGLLLCGALFASLAAAQGYPNKPVRLVIPAPPGGGTDNLGRALAQKMSEGLGQPVVIENRGGAAGNIAHDLVAKAPADGYTIVLVNSAIAAAPSLYKNLSFDVEKDFVAISEVAEGALVLTVHPSVAANNVSELLALAKARPGQLNFASSGSGQINHLAGELMKSMGKVDMQHVPYKGGDTVITDLLSGRTHIYFGGIRQMMPYVRDGKLKVLGVTSAKRARAIPDVPTIAETLPGFELSSWWGILAPAATPKDVVTRLATEVVRAVHSQELQARIRNDGNEPIGSTSDQFAAYMKSEIAKSTRLVRESGAQAD